jgi:PPOX class probable F420-dependent enzyme
MRTMGDDERRAFLMAGTRTGKVAWVGRDGHPHVAPIWFVLDGDDLVFTTAADTAKGRALRRDQRLSITVDEEVAPYAFVKVDGVAAVSEDPVELRRWATAIGGRYMGPDRAEEYGARNGVPGELLVRVRPTRTIARSGVAD